MKAYQSHSTTSPEGFDTGVKNGSFQKQEDAILAYLTESGMIGATGAEIAANVRFETGYKPPGTISARLRGLQTKGLIAKSGEKRRYGRSLNGSVWKLAHYVAVPSETKRDKAREAMECISAFKYHYPVLAYENLGVNKLLSDLERILS